VPILLLVLIVRSFSQKEYRQRLSERFGWLPSNMQSGGIVVHAASVGEVIAAKPFIDKLLLTYPELPITVTTFTPTGSAQVKKLYIDKVQHCYLPLDISFCVHLFFRLLKPKAVVLMETELWPTIIHRCYKSDVKLLLINARLSEKSLKSYKKLSWIITPALNKFSAILCQSADNAEHFIEMGASADLVSNSGNLKYDISVTDELQSSVSQLQKLVPEHRRLLVVGSTHQGEELPVINAYKQLQANNPDILLVLVPRHPERFPGVAKLCAEQGLNAVTRSSQQAITDDTDIWVIDTLGELLAVYALAEICIVAGSFSDVGGHNPLEPALFAKPVVAGENMANFKEITQKLISANGIVQLENNHELAAKLHCLLKDNELATSIGKNAYDVVIANQGATGRCIGRLADILNL